MNPINGTFWNPKTIAWFSCGASSAVLCKKAVETIPQADLVVAHCDTLAEEHPDNRRFKADVERWIGFPITTIRSKKYKTPTEVFVRERFMAGPNGAKCTTELKKVPRLHFAAPEDLHLFGFTSDEAARIRRFEARNPDMRLRWLLLELSITKAGCFQILQSAGIQLPAMYGLGFDHNNCLGCPKAASPNYWNLIRKHFPAVFKARAELSRSLGCRLVKLDTDERIYLDELKEGETSEKQEVVSCGPDCASPAGE